MTIGGGQGYVVAPQWAAPLLRELGVRHLNSFTDALNAAPCDRLVLVDQAARGGAVTNRRHAIAALAARHAKLLVVSYNARMPRYLEPFAEDGPVPDNVEYVGPEVTRGELAAWLGCPAPQDAAEPAWGNPYLRKGSSVTPAVPLIGFKRVYVALDAHGSLSVAGAFGLGYGPLVNTAACEHTPRHPHLGPECADGFAAYLHREDALLFRAPDAALATVSFHGTVIAADSAVTRPGMRGEHQRVHSLEFPRRCDCGAAATCLRLEVPDAAGFTEVRPSCASCGVQHQTATLGELSSDACPLTWLDTDPGA